MKNLPVQNYGLHLHISFFCHFFLQHFLLFALFSSATLLRFTDDQPISEYSSLKRGNWDNETEFRLSVVGLTVGLGSIWLDFGHLLGAFLLPYLVCVVFVGLPMMYLEMVVGQYTNTGPSMIFRHYIPALQVTNGYLRGILTTCKNHKKSIFKTYKMR
uniref:Aa_trans domain-containing protein n=1 Tax=Angiostrongylus cantonensis TaxID=6313 RepID=A0A0K0DK94_ANGCA